MAKSHVLKDKAGRAAGYIMQLGGQIRCRVSLSQQAQAVLLYADGTTDAHSLNAGREESVFPDMEKTLVGAYVFSGSELLLYTDEMAKNTFLQAVQSKRQQHEQKAQPKPIVQTVPPEKTTWPKPEALPQRRWPPPACWDAEYVQGAWRALNQPSGKQDGA